MLRECDNMVPAREADAGRSVGRRPRAESVGLGCRFTTEREGRLKDGAQVWGLADGEVGAAIPELRDTRVVFPGP